MPRQRLFLLFVLVSAAAQGQWLNYPTPGTPRTRDGKANLAAPAPRSADGKPDLSGVWHVHATSLEEFKRIYGAGAVDAASNSTLLGMELDTISKYATDILVDFKPEEVSMRPQAAELFRRRASGIEAFPGATCDPMGIPNAGLVSEATELIQSPRQLVILYEADGTHRQIHTDGRALPKEIVQPAWLGYSAGKWESDILVVESAGFNDRTWLDVMGHPHSEALRITERYHRRDFGHLDVEMIFDDPEMYTKPFTIKYTLDLLPGSDVFETVCNENEKDLTHMSRK